MAGWLSSRARDSPSLRLRCGGRDARGWGDPILELAMGGHPPKGVGHNTFSIKADYIRKIDYSAPSEASESKAAKPAKKKVK